MIVSFYSYKGGVGRTSLALEVAARLATGRLGPSTSVPVTGRVLVWDLDLEAPGVSHFPGYCELASRATQGTLDLLDLLWSEDGDAGPPDDESILSVLREAIVSDPEIAGGNLAVLPVAAGGDDSGLAARLAELDLSALFSRDGPGSAMLARIGQLIEGPLGFDMIVVDARTGVSDLSAAGAVLMADDVVFVIRLDNQDTERVEDLVSGIHQGLNQGAASTEWARGRVWQVANLVPTDPEARGVVEERLLRLREQGVSPHAVVELRQLALVTESVPTLDGTSLSRAADEAYETVAQILHDRRLAARRREAEPTVPLTWRPAPLDLRVETDAFRVTSVLGLRGWVNVRNEVLDAALLMELTKDDDFGRPQSLVALVLRSEPPLESDLRILRNAAPAGGAFTRMIITEKRIDPASIGDDVIVRSLDQLVDEVAPAAPLLDAAERRWLGTQLDRQYVSPWVVPLHADGTRGEGRRSLDEMVEGWVGTHRSGLLAILGDFGAGKTTFCMRLCWRLAQGNPGDELIGGPPIVSLYVDLREAGATGITLEGLVVTGLTAAGRPARELDGWMFRVSTGSVVLVIDGFDELLAYTDPSRMARLLADLQTAAEGCRIVLTSRTSYFRSHGDAVQEVGGPLWDRLMSRSTVPDEGRDAGRDAERPATVIEVQPFDEQQVDTYLRRRFGPRRGREILPRLQRLHPLDELARRPYLLTLVAETVGHWEATEWPEEVTLAALYDGYVSQWLDRDRSKRPLLGAMDDDDVINLVEDMAVEAWDRPGAQLDTDELRRTAADALRASTARSVGRHEEEQAEAEVRTALFLVRNDEGIYRFAHRSFLEYFLARRLARMAPMSDTEGWRATLDLGALSPEVSQFLRGWPEAGAAVARASALVLAGPYAPRVSENALRLAYAAARDASDDDGAVVVVESGSTVNLAGARLEGMDLRGLVAPGADLRGARLHGADLARADLRGARLRGVDLSAADLDRADLRRAELDGARLDDASLRRALLEGVGAEGASLVRVAAPEADLGRARLGGTDLSGADLSGADLSGADLSSARLLAATIDGASTAGIDLGGSDTRHLRARAEGLATASLASSAHRPPAASDVAVVPVTTMGDLPSFGPARTWAMAAVRGAGPDGRDLVVLAHDEDGLSLVDPHVDAIVRVLASPTIPSLRFRSRALAVASAGPGARRLVVDGTVDGRVRLWDAATGEQIWEMPDDARSSMVDQLAIVVAPTGAIQVVTGGRAVTVWDVTTGERRTFGQASYPTIVTAVEVAGRPHVVYATFDGLAAIDVETGEEVHRQAMSSSVWRMVALGGSRVALVTVTRPLEVIDVATGITTTYGPSETIDAASGPRDDGPFLAISHSRGWTDVWDQDAEVLIERLMFGHAGAVVDGSHGPALALLGGEYRPTFGIFAALPAHRPAAPPGAHRAVPISVEGRPALCSVSLRTGFVVWDLVAGRPVVTAHPKSWGWRNGISGLFTDVGDPRRVVAWDSTPGPALLSIGPDGLDARVGEAAPPLEPVPEPFRTRVVMAPNGEVRVVSSPYNSDTIISAPVDGAHGGSLRPGGMTVRIEEEVLGVVAVPGLAGDHLFAVAGGDGRVRTFRWDDGRHEADFGEGRERCLAGLGSDVLGAVVATGDHQGAIRVWDARSGRLHRTLLGHEDAVVAVAAGPAGAETTLLSASVDGTIRLWSVATGELLAVVDSGHAKVVDLLVEVGRSDGTVVSALCADGTMRVWDLARPAAPHLALAAYADEEWAAVRIGGRVDDGEGPVGWGTRQGVLDTLRLGRYDAVDIGLTFPEAIEYVD